MSQRRSWLFTPGTRKDRFARAGEAGADVLILDLEDAVALADKAAARADALAYLATDRNAGPARALRINALRTRAGIDDLQALLAGSSKPDVLVLPKVESAAEVSLVNDLLTEAGSSAALVALIESARGLQAAGDIAAATPRLTGLMLGAADLSADLGAQTSWEVLLFARSRLIAAAASAGIAAIDSPCFEWHDAVALEAEAARVAALGFTAKAAIHPRQIATINQAFTPSAAVIAECRRILAAASGGVGVIDGRMIDEAMARRARRLLAAAGEAAR